MLTRLPDRSLRAAVVAVLLAGLLLAGCRTADGPAADPAPVTDPPEQVEPDDPEEPQDPDTSDGPDPSGEPGPDDDRAEQSASDEPDGSRTADEPPDDPDLGVEVELEEVVRMDSPIAGAVGPDGTLYLAERAGTVHPIRDGTLGEAVVDVSDRTTVDGERGLLGIAFAADGTEFYASYTAGSGDNVLAAFPVTDATIDGDDPRTVMTVAQPRSNHNGGDVHVGPDGLVYWAIGDGGGGGDPQGNGQDLSTRLGALLRIDPQAAEPYGVPADNPFVDTEGAAPEIWASGLRNPWRFSFDPVTDQLWIADVGQASFEEINRVPADLPGANFGWNLMEATSSFAGSEPDDHVPPIHAYDSSGSRCSITGGYVYRGQAIPELRGAYLFSDFCEGDVRALGVDRQGAVRDTVNLGIHGGSVVSFAEDADGELYVLDLGGRVSRIVPAG